MANTSLRTERSAATGSQEAPRSPLRRFLDREGWYFLDLFALCGFAIVQPVLDVTGDAPDFFLFRSAGRVEILLLVAVIVLVPPLALWALEVASGALGGRVRAALHVAFVTGLLAIVAVEAGKLLTPLRARRLTAVALVVAVALGVLYTRQRWARMWLRYLAPAPLVFALLFAGFSPISRLVLPARAGVAEGAPQVRADVPIVMLVLDELPLASLLDPSGRIDEQLFPNFARLAGDATFYRNTTGIDRSTTYAIPGMLTGRFPQQDLVPSAADYPDNLFTLLESGYDLAVYESITRLCPPERCAASAPGRPGVQGGFSRLVRDTARVWTRVASPFAGNEDPTGTWLSEDEPAPAAGGARRSPAGGAGRLDPVHVPISFRQFLSSIRAGERPTLNFLHILLPHQPWKYLPSGQTYNLPDRVHGHGETTHGWVKDEWPVQLARQRHLLQVAYVDALVGELIERLEAEGLYDEALVVVTADHGVSFVPGTLRRGIQPENEAYIAWVPLIIKAPGQREGKVDDRNVELVDLLPTIADLIGVEVPWKVDGTSLLDPPSRSPDTKTYYNRPGERLTLDARRGFQEVLRIAAQPVGNPARGLAGLFEAGPCGQLVHTPAGPPARPPAGAAAACAARLRARQPAVDLSQPVTVRLDEPGAWARVDPAGAKVPAYVSGEVVGAAGVRGPLHLAVSVNGVIGGVAQTFHDRDSSQRFAAMIDPALLRPGANRLEVSLLLPAGASMASVKLWPLPQRSGG